MGLAIHSRSMRAKHTKDIPAVEGCKFHAEWLPCVIRMCDGCPGRDLERRDLKRSEFLLGLAWVPRASVHFTRC